MTVPRFPGDGNLARMNRFEFLECVRRNPFNTVILERLPSLGLADCWLVSGALFQTVRTRLSASGMQTPEK